MPANKNKLLRLQTIEKCLKNTGRRWYLQDIIDEVNKVLEDKGINPVQKRIIQYDLKEMESSDWGAPIVKEKDGRKVYYAYDSSEKEVSIFKKESLNDEEVRTIGKALESLAMLSGAPQFEEIQEVLPLLNERFGFEEMPREVINYDAVIDLKGKGYVNVLYNAIKYKRVLNVTYQPFGSETPFIRTMHMHYLKQYNNRWYAFGYNQEENFDRMLLALDRIVNVEETDAKYIETKIDWKEHFDNRIGVGNNLNKDQKEESETVELKFGENAMNYVVTKPIHGSQKVNKETNTVIIDLVPNNELVSLILSYGSWNSGVEVVRPAYLREIVKQKLSDMLAVNQ